MDFGPFGASELLFVAVLALLIFGPKRLPELSQAAGRMVTKLRRATTDLKRTYEAELERAPDLRAVAEQVEDAKRGARGEIESLGTGGLAKDLRELGASVESAGDELRQGGADEPPRARPPEDADGA